MSDSGTVAAAQRTCGAATKQGTPCKSWALPESDRCVAHDPARATQMHAARAKGGAAAGKLRMLRGRRLKLDSAGALLTFTSGVVQDTLGGIVSPDVARAVLYGVSIQRQLVESGDLERRLAAIEEQLSERQPTQRPARGLGRWGA